MVRLKLSIELNYDVLAPGCDFIFNIHAAHTPCQTVVMEKLVLSQQIQPHIYTEPATRNRFMRLTANKGPLKVSYTATVDIAHYFAQPYHLKEVPISQLPAHVLSYIYPSRYCQSDRLHTLALRKFGGMEKTYARVQAIQDWVREHVTFTSGASNPSTSAVDTLIDERGVCRDFSHLMIAACRAINIPARFTTGIDYGADPVLGPPDFHAYTEVYIGDRWYIFDPSNTAIPMGFVRFGTGYDAANAAFATIFGPVCSSAPIVSIEAINDEQKHLVMPYHCSEAVSTDDGILNLSAR